MASRSLDDLVPAAREAALRVLECARRGGLDVLVTCTYRSPEEQDALYARGRTVIGAIVTNARGGESAHNRRAAFDVVLLRDGKPVWGTTRTADRALWAAYGACVRAAGLVWLGDSQTFPEFAHAELKHWRTL